MTRKILVCGFYTQGTPYQQEIQGLVKSCEEHGLKVYIQGYESRGSWVRNCAIKPEFIYETMVRFRDYNIVYVDADAKIQQYPSLFDDLTCDLAVHYRNGRELLSGTIFVQNTPKMQEFLRYWISLQGTRPREWDQRVLQHCIERYSGQMKLNVLNLPANYTQIYDLMAHCGKPVIEHYQASRRYNRMVDPELMKLIPEKVMGLRPRISDDGTFFLTRCTPQIEVLLNKDFCKFTGENRWYPRTQSALRLDDLLPYFKGKECYVVGKGPSLDRLSLADFTNPDVPVICINESIKVIEKLGLPNRLFVLQQDAWLKDTCKPTKEGTIMLIGYACQHWYHAFRNKFCFHYIEIGLTKHNISAVYAIAIAKCCKCTGFRLYAFDAAVSKELTYAKSIGYDALSGGPITRFLNHRVALIKTALPLPLEFHPSKPC